MAEIPHSPRAWLERMEQFRQSLREARTERDLVKQEKLLLDLERQLGVYETLIERMIEANHVSELWA